MDEIDRQKKKQKLILLDTRGYSWILFFWILGKFLGSSIQVSMTTPQLLLALKMSTSENWWETEERCWFEEGVTFTTDIPASRKLHAKLQARIKARGASRTMRVVKKGKLLTHSDGTSLQNGAGSYWRGFYPIGLRTLYKHPQGPEYFLNNETCI